MNSTRTLASIVALMTCLTGFTGPALADEEQPEVSVVTIAIVPTPTPAPALPAPPTPVPTVRPELPGYSYDEADMRCLSRGIWSVTPSSPSYNTKLAFCEVVQNRVDDDSGAYADSIRYVLLQPNEFLDYDPDAHRSDENDAIAGYAMRSWAAAQLGDRSYRLTPKSGVMCDFYSKDSYDYIIVKDKDGNVVYDSEVSK